MSRDQRNVLSRLDIAVSATVAMIASAVILIGETTQEYSRPPYLIIDHFKSVNS